MEQNNRKIYAKCHHRACPVVTPFPVLFLIIIIIIIIMILIMIMIIILIMITITIMIMIIIITIIEKVITRTFLKSPQKTYLQIFTHSTIVD